jgi:dTDP-glucose 4,6-dehydratase
LENLIVTGGAGFIGSHFVRKALASRAWRVVAADKLTYAGSLLNLEDVKDDPDFRFVRMDISRREDVASLFREHPPAVVVNFAAETHVDRSIDSPRTFVETNVAGVLELLEASRERLRDLPEGAREAFRFLHVSTDEVYGSLGPGGSFSEESPCAPNSPYAATKAGADHLVRAYRETYGLPVLLTNCSNNYGPRQYPEKLIPLMVLNALDGRELPLYGDGGNVRDWLHVEDHVEALLEVLRRGRPGGKYNIGARNERTNLEVVETLCSVLDEVRPPSSEPSLRAAGVKRHLDLLRRVEDRPGHDRRYAIDPSLVERELGWKARRPFRDGLRETVLWYRDHRDWAAKVLEGKYGRERLGRGGPS